jgi:ectoine hydroxylase-related dioxygenase (phytanoyl-CoA dioxygenase family)
VDLSRTSEDAPLFGFILAVDAFRNENGATRFVPGSHQWPDVPTDRLPGLRAEYPGEILALGDPGTMILFNAAIRHGHTANVTERPRRSIQGYFVKRSAAQAFCFRSRLAEHVQARMSSRARHLLALDGRH